MINLLIEDDKHINYKNNLKDKNSKDNNSKDNNLKDNNSKDKKIKDSNLKDKKIKDSNLKNSNLKDKNNVIFYKSKKNIQCIGPCYPPNYLYIDPFTFKDIYENDYTCPFGYCKDDEECDIDICDEKQCTDNYLNFNINDTYFYIASTNELFLEIFNITKYTDIILFIENEYDSLPLYTQKRIINTIFNVYKNNNKLLSTFYIKSVLNIYNNLYKTEVNYNIINKYLSKLSKKNKEIDIFIYLHTKINKN